MNTSARLAAGAYGDRYIVPPTATMANIWRATRAPTSSHTFGAVILLVVPVDGIAKSRGEDAAIAVDGMKNAAI